MEILVRNGEPLDSEVVGSALQELRKYEFATGGFVRDIGGSNPITWFTSWSLRMMHFLRTALSSNLRTYFDRYIKRSSELSRKLEYYEGERRLEKNLITFFVFSYIALALSVTYLLYLATGSLHGKILWYSFFVTSLFILEIITAYYWYKRKKLNAFRAFLLALASTAIDIFFGLV